MLTSSLALFAALTWAEPDSALPPLTVVSRVPEAVADTPSSVSRIDREAISETYAVHPQELFVRMPGMWVSRGSGQEHLMALRSPVLTGPGACGAYLVLEDGVSLRPPTFCNVNGLFEAFWTDLTAIEVQRGPGQAAYGANAFHGVISLRHQPPFAASHARMELGEHDTFRAHGATSLSASGAVRLATELETIGSFRDNERADSQKIRASGTHGVRSGTLDWSLTATNLNQETAGFIFGEDAYRDEALRRGNVNPEAYRDARSARAIAHYGSSSLELTGYLRNSSMEFIQHFLPGQPIERNAQTSGGLLASTGFDLGRLSGRYGLELDYADIRLDQFQPAAITDRPDFIAAIRPQGQQYDFDVSTLVGGGYFELLGPMTNSTEWRIGARVETARYDYDNLMLDGNTDADGNECPLGGCLYQRPADRSDRYSYVTGSAALVGGDAIRWRARYARAVRPPQVTELYRLQRGQSVADIDPETMDSLEFGLGWQSASIGLDVSTYLMDKRNVIIRGSDGFVRNDGKTRHIGLELEAWWQPLSELEFDAAFTVASHEYRFSGTIGRETVTAGNEVDTAPTTLGSARATWRPSARFKTQLEWTHTGSYFVDAANANTYPGHDLLHLRAAYDLGQGWTWSGRLMNLTDRRYAERADFAFGNFRYFPGQGRTVFMGISYEAD